MCIYVHNGKQHSLQTVTVFIGGADVGAQSCLTLCDPMGCSPQSSTAHEILQAIILAWVARLPFPPPGDSPNPGIEPKSLSSPPLAGGFFTTVLPAKPPSVGASANSQTACML